MEPLYKKLYNKYTTLKSKKWYELDELNREQEVNFLEYVSAAEDLIQHLQNENKGLHSQVNDLKSEVASLRSSKDNQCAEYQKLLNEKTEKNKMLSEELERLRKLKQVGISSSTKYRRTSNGRLSTSSGEQTASRDICGSNSRSRKSKKHSGSEKEIYVQNMLCGSGQDDILQKEPAKDLHTEVQQPECCRAVNKAGAGVNVSSHTTCPFQALIEYMVGMKFSMVAQTKRIIISAMHESSGYSFGLEWPDQATGEEVQLKYHVLSLGKVERLAPFWMKEVIMFKTTMCPVFFERVCRIMKLLS